MINLSRLASTTIFQDWFEILFDVKVLINQSYCFIRLSRRPPWLILQRLKHNGKKGVKTLCSAQKQAKLMGSSFCRNARFELQNRGFNKFLHKWVLNSNRRVYLPKARRPFDLRRVRGHALPDNFAVLDSRRCIFMHFQVFFCCFVVSFFCS